MATKPYNPAEMISSPSTTSTGSGKTLPLDPIYTSLAVIVLAIIIPLVVMYHLGRKNNKALALEREALRATQAATEAKIRAGRGQDIWQGR